MSFNIQLYQNKSRKITVDKDIEKKGDAISGNLVNDCDIINPVILLKIDDVSDYMKDVNYMHIPKFGRYYYIDNIISKRNRLVEIHGHVDVLMTYKAELRKNECIIARYNKVGSNTLGNTYLQDERMAVYQDSFVSSYNFPKKFDRNKESFVLIVAGSHS